MGREGECLEGEEETRGHASHPRVQGAEGRGARQPHLRPAGNQRPAQAEHTRPGLLPRTKLCGQTSGQTSRPRPVSGAAGARQPEPASPPAGRPCSWPAAPAPINTQSNHALLFHNIFFFPFPNISTITCRKETPAEPSPQSEKQGGQLTTRTAQDGVRLRLHSCAER